MEPDGVSPRSQVPATCPVPTLKQIDPVHVHIPLLEDPF